MYSIPFSYVIPIKDNILDPLKNKHVYLIIVKIERAGDVNGGSYFPSYLLRIHSLHRYTFTSSKTS